MNNYDYSQYTRDAEITAKESYRIKDGAGGRGIFIPDLVRDITQFQPSLGVKVIDVIMAPAGANHPLVVAGRLQQGQMTHICWVYVHKGVGQDWWICPARTWGKPCPICEHRTRLQADPDVPDQTVKLYGSGKYPIGIYKMVHHLNPNQITWQEPVMVWPINNSFMESTLQSMAKQPMTSDECPTGYINYMWPTAGPQGGRHIKFEVKAKGQYFDYDGHQFITRRNPVPGHIMDAAKAMPPLDELLYMASYEEIKDALEVSLAQPVGGQPTGGAYVAEQNGHYPGEMGYGQPAAPVFGTPEPQCPFSDYGGVFGVKFGAWEECKTCELSVKCEEAMPKPVVQPQPVATQAPQPTVQPQPVATQAPAPVTEPPQAAQRQAPIPKRPQR